MKVKSRGQCLARDESPKGLRKDMTSRRDDSSCTVEAAGGQEQSQGRSQGRPKVAGPAQKQQTCREVDRPAQVHH